ncbi:MAG: protein phosphatase CheZ [Deltaproteobacteria bacterium]|nr:protein phosphatase CheZ [Deltaproteobacteria bacterium]
MSTSPPVIGFELGVGEFRIVTPEAIYQIKVTPELVKANTGMGVISPGASLQSHPQDAAAPQAPEDSVHGSKDGSGTAFFQEISQELFGSIGQLARQLSISVNELPVAEGDGLSRTGEDLEDAKGQLEEVVEITEKASIQIMDLTDLIQADVDNLNKQMSALNNLEFIIEPKGEDTTSTPNDVSGANGKDYQAFVEKFGELKSVVEKLSQGSGGNGSPKEAPEPAPVAAPSTMVVFSLDTIFQTLYEFCTNESVKDHIKEMRESLGDFDEEPIIHELSELALNIGEDDGLYNIPLSSLLKIIYTHTKAEKHREILKKMNQTLGSIFLDSNLPLEGQVEEVPAKVAEVPVAASTAIAQPGNGGAGQYASLGHLVGELDSLIAGGALVTASGGSAGGGGQGTTTILNKDRDVIIQTIGASDKLIKNTTNHLTHIMEALSFQDLSGQRIKKIVALIGEIQVQLLSMLVSVDTKIKAHHEAPAARRPKEETDKVAQAEVDKMLEKLSTTGEPSELKGPGAESRLDQGAVNDLLSQLGF